MDTLRQDVQQKKIQLDTRLKKNQTSTIRVVTYWNSCPEMLCNLHPWRHPKKIEQSPEQLNVTLEFALFWAEWLRTSLPGYIILWLHESFLHNSYSIYPPTAPHVFMIFPPWAMLCLPCTHQTVRELREIWTWMRHDIHFHHIISAFGTK